MLTIYERSNGLFKSVVKFNGCMYEITRTFIYNGTTINNVSTHVETRSSKEESLELAKAWVSDLN